MDMMTVKPILNIPALLMPSATIMSMENSFAKPLSCSDFAFFS